MDLDLGLGFGTWIWDLDLELGFGTGLGLDNFLPTPSIVYRSFTLNFYFFAKKGIPNSDNVAFSRLP